MDAAGGHHVNMDDRHPAKSHRIRRPREREAGAGIVEYVGVITAVAIVVLLLATNAGALIGQQVVCGLSNAIAVVSGQPTTDCGALALSEPKSTGLISGCDSTTPTDNPTWAPTGTTLPAIPTGLDPDSDLVETLMSTQRGRDTLQWLADNNITINIDSNETGGFFTSGTMTITLGPGFGTSPVVIHEANHARYAVDGRTVNTWEDVRSLSRDAYVNGMLAEEADGSSQAIRAAKEFRAAGYDVPQQNGERQYDQAYADAIKNGRTMEEAHAAGHEAVLDLFEDGTFKGSNSGKSYPDIYGDYWDAAN